MSRVKNIVQDINVMHTKSGMQDLEGRKLTEAEEKWLISQIKSVAEELHPKTGKMIRSRKKVTAMYVKCWEQLMSMQHPPKVKHWTDLKKIVSRDAEKCKQQGFTC